MDDQCFYQTQIKRQKGTQENNTSQQVRHVAQHERRVICYVGLFVLSPFIYSKIRNLLEPAAHLDILLHGFVFFHLSIDY